MTMTRMLPVGLLLAVLAPGCSKKDAAAGGGGAPAGAGVTITWDSPASTNTLGVNLATFADPAWTMIKLVANCPQVSSAVTNGSVDTSKLPTVCPDYRTIAISIEEKVKPGKYAKGVHVEVNSTGGDKPNDTLGDPIAGKGVEITSVTAGEIAGTVDYQDARGRSVKGAFVAKR